MASTGAKLAQLSLGGDNGGDRCHVAGMKMLASFVLICAPAAATAAQPGDCREAVERYRTAQADARLAADRYGRCVTRANGEDDCTSEFRNVRDAHEEFEQATSDVETLCRQGD